MKNKKAKAMAKASGNYPVGEKTFGKEVARFIYYKADGTPYGMVKRMEPKQFPQYHHEWVTNFAGDERNWLLGEPKEKIPYNLPDFKRDAPYIAIFEGEGNVDCAIDIGFAIATCATGGASPGAWKPELAQYFVNRRVVVFADNDKAGRRHARSVYRALQDTCSEIVIVYIDRVKNHGDIVDLVAAIGAKEAFEYLSRKADIAFELKAICELDDRKDAIGEFVKKWKLTGRADANKLVTKFEEDLARIKKEAGYDLLGTLDEHGRIIHEQPHANAELRPIMEFLDDVLCNVDSNEPPMRTIDIDPMPVEVRALPPMGMHLLTKASADAEEDKKDHLPPPPVLAFSQHNETSLQIEIEKHICFIQVTDDGGVIPVALQSKFVKAYMLYRQSKLTNVGVIANLPLLLPNGELISESGVNKQLHTVFRIDPIIAENLPKGRITKAQVREAIRYAFDDLLVDVKTNRNGKYVILALMLTVIERSMFPQRPVFFITAGKSGGGKTTTLHMASMLVLGTLCAASSWSDDKEERRKTMFALARQGVPLVLWDNIPRGHKITCPTLEKHSTSETVRDRVLSESREETVSSYEVHVLTGNNISAIGDLAKRALQAVIDITQVDPENRPFVHEDIMRWIRENRVKLLVALYTILMANPRLYQAERDRAPAKTRFKDWWHIVGASLEYASIVCDDPEPLDFSKLFNEYVEADDEESSDAEVIDAIANTRLANLGQPDLGSVEKANEGGWFKASHILEFMMRDDGSNEDKTRRMTMKGRFVPNNQNNNLTPRHVSSILDSMKDTPLAYGGNVLTLRRYVYRQTKFFKAYVTDSQGKIVKEKW